MNAPDFPIKSVCVPFPADELRLIDLTVRMFVEPVLQADIPLLAKVWGDEHARKTSLLEALGIEPADLQSADKFADALRAEGVEPETKLGPARKDGTRERIYAFAKTDDFMLELLEHDDERVRTLAEARLALKSTLDQRRAERLGFMGQRGALCAYYCYAGTHTTLWSGGDRLNFQNFKRDSEIRQSIKAPAGYLLAKIDQSQVQCRLVNWLAGEEKVLERFRRGEDPYTDIASQFYGHEITKADKAERGTGKQLELSCGFGSGAQTIKRTAKRGTYGPPVELTDKQALQARNLYRETHPHVTGLWTWGDQDLIRMAHGQAQFNLLGKDFLPVYGTTVLLPGNLPIHWPELQYDQEWQSYKFMHKRNRWRRIWGGFLTQNVVSALASVLVRQAMLRITRLGYRIVLQEHDAIGVLVVDDARKDDTLALLIDEMRRPPYWGPDLPLNAEGSLAETYQ
jgi:DNA polymerase